VITEEQRADYEKKFAEAQDQILESFRTRMKDAAERAISDLYQDASNYAATDAHTNFYNLLRDEARDEFRAEIAGKYGVYSWAHDMRMLLLKHHKDELSNKIIEDLQENIAALTVRMRQIEERYR
jgi:hypothetical protein